MSQQDEADRTELRVLKQRTRAIVQTQAARKAEVAEARARLGAERETTAAAAVGSWLTGNARAIGSLGHQLDEAVKRCRENPNPRDATVANEVWAKVCERQLLAFVVERRFPDAKAANAPAVLPPGRRGVDAAGLSIATWYRPTQPVIVAWWPREIRARAWQWAAHEWITANLARLPDELRVIVAASPTVSMFEEPTRPEDRVTAERAGVLALRAVRGAR